MRCQGLGVTTGNHMANRNYPSQRLFTMHLLPVQLDMQVSIGSSGAPTIINSSGKGIASITRLAAGQYRLQLQDNYASLLALDVQFQSPVTGSAVAGGAFSVGTVYQIVTLGNTTQAQFVAAGLPTGIAAAPGVIFKAATVGAGTGTVKALGTSGVSNVELIGNPQLMLSNQPFTGNNGGFINFQCLAPTSSSVTTAIAADPANGAVMMIQLLLNNSQIQ